MNKKDFRTLIESYKDEYLNYHMPRYEDLMKIIASYNSTETEILDIGNSRFSEIVATLFKCQVDELGFAEDSQRSFGKRFKFDLNNAQEQELWRTDIGPYDIIIFAEVIEHLYTSPNLVLNFLSSLLKKGGKLIIQTPNATVFHKRIQLLLGQNPYMLINENNRNPGHFREYTKSELKTYAKKCGFEVADFYYGNYFDYRYTFAQSNQSNKKNYLSIVNWIYAICPPSFRPGITMVLQKP